MPLQEQKLTGLKKRQQIESASRTMFIWVAVASVAISVCLVSSQFFFQRFAYNNRVVGAKLTAASTLTQNISNAQQLKTNVDALVANQDLASVKLSQTDPNTKSVLDALPSVLDTTALATSLQQAILAPSGVVVENITVGQASTVAPAATATIATPTAASAQPIEQPFSVTVSGSYDKINKMVLDIERTIRPIKILSLNLSGDDSAMHATIDGVTYYQPAKTTNIQQKVVQ